MKRFRRILYPTDFSKAAGPAFTRALQMAEQNRAELLLVHVLPPSGGVRRGRLRPPEDVRGS